MGSSPVAVTQTSDFAPALSKGVPWHSRLAIQHSLWNAYVTREEHTVITFLFLLSGAAAVPVFGTVTISLTYMPALL